jgi:hypothetical protein
VSDTGNARLGLHCCRCCAGLIAILLVIGVMDLRAMAVVGAAITVERIAPAGERGRASGRGLCGGHRMLSDSNGDVLRLAISDMAAGMKRFQHEWIFEPFAGHRTFFSKSMFGGLAAYLFERQMLVLVEPTKSGRWNWHGVLICTDYAHHASIQTEFPPLQPHAILRKWLFIDSTHNDFEWTMEAVAKRMAANDRRFGIVAKGPKRRKVVTT